MAIAVLGGLVVGILVGTLGGGGAILAVPLLTFGAGLAPHEATVGSLVVVGVGALVGLAQHGHNGHTRPVTGLAFGLLGLPGSYLGSVVARLLDGELLLALFAALLIAVAASLIRKNARANEQPDRVATERSTARATRRPFALIGAAALATGFLTGLFGVGGGFLVVPALMFALAMPMSAAVGTSLVVVALNSAISLALHAGTAATLPWPLIIAMTAAAVVGALGGGAISSRVSSRTLQRIFAFALGAVAIFTAAQSVPALVG